EVQGREARRRPARTARGAAGAASRGPGRRARARGLAVGDGRAM
ncbi:MAG: hypothetical protein AVDCRST_MAG66-2179, partial [uncultured Pseudonocardia sp.]